MTIFFDFDSTLVSKESLDEVIALALADSPDRIEQTEAVAAITDKGMEGAIPFTESVRQRLAVAPVTHQHFEAIGKELCEHITPRMAELCAELIERGHEVYIISGGFKTSILPVAKLLGVHADNVWANTYTTDQSGVLTGVDTDNPCFTDFGKSPVIEAIVRKNAPPRPYVMVGDGANDLAAFESDAVDHFCGFAGNKARTVILERAPRVAYTTSELRDFLFSEVAV